MPRKIRAKPSVIYPVIILFLEFFAWGLLTTPTLTQLNTTFAGDTLLINGFIQGIKGFLSFLSAPLIGAFSDAKGRKPLLLITVVATCLPIPLLIIRPYWFFALLSLSGIFSVTYTIIFAYVSDITDENERNSAFGLVSATFAASLVISPAIGTIIDAKYGSWMVVLIATVAAVLDIFFIIFFVPESLDYKRRFLVDHLDVAFDGNDLALSHSDFSNNSNSSSNLQNKNTTKTKRSATTTPSKITQSHIHSHGVKAEVISPMIDEEQQPNDESESQSDGLDNSNTTSLLKSIDENNKNNSSKYQFRRRRNNNHNKMKISWDQIDPFKALRSIADDRNLWMISLAVALSYFPEAGQYSTFPLYLMTIVGFSAEKVSLFIAWVGTLAVLSQVFLLNWLTTTFHQRTAILIGLICQFTQLVIYAFTTNSILIWSFGISLAISSIIYPAMNGWCSLICDQEQQGVIQGILTGVRGLCMGIGPAIYGLIFHLCGVNLDSDDATFSVGVETSAMNINSKANKKKSMQRIHHKQSSSSTYPIPASSLESSNNNSLNTIQQTTNENLFISSTINNNNNYIIPGPPFLFAAISVILAIIVVIMIQPYNSSKSHNSGDSNSSPVSMSNSNNKVNKSKHVYERLNMIDQSNLQGNINYQTTSEADESCDIIHDSVSKETNENRLTKRRFDQMI